VLLGERQDCVAEGIDQLDDCEGGLVHLLRVDDGIAVADQVANLHGRREMRSQLRGQHAFVGQECEVITQAGNRPPTLVGDDMRTNMDGFLPPLGQAARRVVSAERAG